MSNTTISTIIASTTLLLLSTIGVSSACTKTITADELVRAKFNSCLLNPRCKIGDIKIVPNSKKNEKKLINPISIINNKI